MTRRWLALALVAAAGCATSGRQRPAVAALDPRVAAAFAALAPARSQQVHKVSVQVGGRDLVLTGYLVLDRALGFRGAAVDELGGKLLDFVRCEGASEVARTPPPLAAAVVAGGPMGDLALGFLTPVGEPTVTAATAATQEVEWVAGERRVRCTVDLAAGRVTACQEWRGRRREREVAFVGSGPTPRRLEVHHHRLHYRMEVAILEVTETAAGERPAWCP